MNQPLTAPLKFAPSAATPTVVDTLDPERVIIFLLRQPARRGPGDENRAAVYPILPVAAASVGSDIPIASTTTSPPLGGIIIPPIRPVTRFALGAVGDKPVGARRGFLVEDAPVTVALAYWATEDFTTAGTDTVEKDRWFDGRIMNAGTVTRSVGLTALDRQALATESGQIVLANADGGLDSLPDSPIFSGMEAIMMAGRRGSDLASWQVIYSGRVESADVSEDTATLTYISPAYILQEEFFTTAYAGTGGIEGPASLAGVRKPLLLGRCFNMTPVLIDTTRYIFQIGAQQLQEVTGVRHGGVPLTPTVDYPDFAALQAATVATGTYATCLAQGLVRAGLTAAGTSSFAVTVDAAGPEDRAGRLARNIAGEAATKFVIGADLVTFERLFTAFPNYIYGRYITDAVTWENVLNDIMRNLNAYWGVNRYGFLVAGWFDPPEQYVGDVLELGAIDLLAIDRMGLPDGFQWPHNERTLNYRRNWTPQANTAAIVNDPTLSVEYLKVGISASAVRPNAVTPPLENMNLQNKDAADDLVLRLLQLHGVPRAMFSIRVPMALGIPGALSYIRLTYPRFGLAEGRTMVVVAAAENYDAEEITLTLWG